jgi:transcriptional regulator with XRE-family HTH domain
MGAQYPILGQLQPKNLWKNTYRNFGTNSPMKDEIDPVEFGCRVRERRKEFNWSQKDLGKESGYSQSNIGWVELGTAKDPQKQALRLAKALRLHVDWLLYKIGPRETGPAIPTPEQFKEIYGNLSIEGRQALATLAAKYQKRKKSA